MYLKERNNKKSICITVWSANNCLRNLPQEQLSLNDLCETERERKRSLPGSVLTSSFLLSLTFWRGIEEIEVWNGISEVQSTSLLLASFQR